MVVIYVVSALTILGINYSAIPGAFGEIFSGAFTGLGIAGGFFGAKFTESLPTILVRRFIILVGLTLSGSIFYINAL